VFFKVNGRYFWVRVAALVVLVIVLGGLGVAAYNAGVQTGVNQAVQVTNGDGTPVVVAPVPYYHPWGWGFGFFGIFFWIIGFFLIIGLLRAIFGFGRWGRGGWGRGGWGPGGWDKYGYGAGGDHGGPSGPGGQGGPGPGGREDRIAEWHRELHRRDQTGQSASDPVTGRPTSGPGTGPTGPAS
jgi:hypothetical protein